MTDNFHSWKVQHSAYSTEQLSAEVHGGVSHPLGKFTHLWPRDSNFFSFDINFRYHQVKNIV